MASVKDRAAYHAPPQRWPFPSLGRNAFLGVGAFLLLLILLPFWGSISVAAVFAFGLTKPVNKISNWIGRRRRLASALFVTLLTVLFFFPATIFGMRVYELATAPKDKNIFSTRTVEYLDSAYKKLEALAVRFGVGSRLFENGGDAQESLRNTVSAGLTKSVAIVSGALASLPEIIITLLVFALFLYAFLAYPREIKRFAFRLNIFRRADLKRSIAILQTSSYDSLVANFLVGALQASIITIGAAALGYREYVLIFSVVFVVSYIPFIGAAPVGYFIALLMLLSDGTGPAIIMAAIATFTGVVDNVARSYLVSGGENEIHPILSFAAILGAIAVLGLKGIFLGPVILTSTAAFLGARNGSSKKREKKTGGIVKLFKQPHRYYSEKSGLPKASSE